jgi:thiosulfate/3-mercaptopyruvate sulfurtransferase
MEEKDMTHHRGFASILVLLTAALLLPAHSSADEPAGAGAAASPEMDTLVSVEWLSEHLGDPGLVVLDCTVVVEFDEQGAIRMVNGRDNYEAGHVPTAGFADLMGELSDTDSPLEFTVPAPEQFAASMRALGVSDDSRVVLYDANRSVWAARVWWMLRWIGFDRAAVLDGGLGAWTAAGHPLSTEPNHPATGTLTLDLRPGLIADRDEVLASLAQDDVLLVDAMSGAHYRGEMAMYARPGHIAGARNMPSNLLLDETGRYRPLDELGMLIDGNPGDRTITYCGGGIAAAADAFVLTRLGFTNVAVYDASLEEWAADPANPMETGDGTGGQK